MSATLPETNLPLLPAQPPPTARSPHAPTIALVGNPNAGKTTLFNRLTGMRAKTANFPGTTVEYRRASLKLGEQTATLVDLPGLYSLDAVTPDEQVARDALDGRLPGRPRPDLILAVVDATNLERNLCLASQVLELGRPVVVALTLSDAAESQGIAVDLSQLKERLGAPVVAVSARTGQGIDALLSEVVRGIEQPAPPRLDAELAACGSCRGCHYSARYDWAESVAAATVTGTAAASGRATAAIDRVLTHRVAGLVCFGLVMALMFVLIFWAATFPMDLIDGLFGLAGETVGTWLPDGDLKSLLVDGVIGGVGGILVFLPQICLLFFVLALLEDTGYMARAAFVMDRAMRAIGLPGKSFVPLIIGFGCNVPAIMATRTLESRHDRVLTVMMAPFMSCGARLPVYALFAAAFFPTNGQNLVFGLYGIGILAAVGTGFLLKNTVLKGEVSPFIMELPPYHLPTVRTVVLRAWDRLKAFMFRAGRVIVPVVLVLNVLNSVGTDGSFGHQDSTESVLSAVGRGIVPAFRPMGMTDDNWPAAVGVFTGILAKETVVGTLNALYTQLGTAGSGEARPSEQETIGAKFLAALATIPENLAKVLDALVDPLGLDVSYTREGAGAAERLEVAPAGFTAMAARFDGQAGAFAYLLMILLYMPCVAAVGAIYHEIGWRWTVFAAGWTTGLGWCAATIFYQVARFGRDPATASFWIVFCAMLLAIAMTALHAVGHASARRRPQDLRGPALGNRLGGIRP